MTQESDPKHSPGPWLAPDADSVQWANEVIHIFDAGNKYRICGVRHRTTNECSERDHANVRLIAAAPDLDAYRRYVEDNLERIERGGWTPVCFNEFCTSEEIEGYR